MDGSNRTRTLASSGGDPFHRTAPDISCGEDPRHARLEREGPAIQDRKGRHFRFGNVAVREYKSVFVQGYAVKPTTCRNRGRLTPQHYHPMSAPGRSKTRVLRICSMRLERRG
jgi:hypothetical protein